jgi:Domain of unknown function (DUF4271)
MQDSSAQALTLQWPDTILALSDSVSAIDTVVMDTVAAIPVIPETSLFEGHLLLPKSPNLDVLPLPDAMSWIFLLLVGCILLIAFAQRSGGRPATVLRATFDRSVANQLIRNELSPNSLSIWLMLIAALLSIALFFATLGRYFVGETRPLILDYLSVFGILIGVGITTRALYWISGELFNIPNLIRTHAFDRTVITISCGLILLPLIVLYFYGPVYIKMPTLVLGVVFIGLFYLKDFQRSTMLLWSQPTMNVAHIFYYICAFKILPLFAIIRLGMAL